MKLSLEERFRRLLVMVPYVLQRGSVGVDDVCSKFGLTKPELLNDINLLFMCGLPGYGPGDLIEAFVDGDQVFIRTADYFARPLRLTHQEGFLLYAGAQALSSAGEASPALDRAMERLREALGADALERVNVGVEEPDELSAIKSALESRKRVHLVYQSQSKEELTHRDVDPWGVFFAGGRWYLVGWCHLVTDERTFVLDRIKAISVLERDADIPEDFDPTRYQDLQITGPESFKAILELAPNAMWVADYYPLLSQMKIDDGWTRIEMVFGGEPLAERLLLRLGTSVRIVEPESLRKRVVALAERLLDRYESDLD